MKLIYCYECGDLFNLGYELKRCSCGKAYGRYLNNQQAEVSPDSISVAIGNGSFDKAIMNMAKADHATADRTFFRDNCRIEYAWVRPNTGPGNPHTIVRE